MKIISDDVCEKPPHEADTQRLRADNARLFLILEGCSTIKVVTARRKASSNFRPVSKDSYQHWLTVRHQCLRYTYTVKSL